MAKKKITPIPKLKVKLPVKKIGKQFDLKKWLDEQIKFWREQRLLHISKRFEYTNLRRLEGIIHAYQNVRLKAFGAKLK
jgi:hypothetical protein